MTRFQTDLLDLRLGDCMDLMRDTPDGFYDLAIVDPPYGIGMDKGAGETKGEGSRKKSDFHAPKDWDSKRPDPVYFQQLKRVSRHQVILGGNYFADLLPASRGWIYWRKLLGGNYSDGELGWTSFDKVVLEFEKQPQRDGCRIHPTQKPVELYSWILTNYAKPGQRILDTHLGSGSIAIACRYFGAHLTATEIDPDYFAAAVERIQRETQQIELFPPAPQHPAHEEIPLL
jgi:site-specific DNA-methyltransferase (adenine-specific)